MRLNFGIYACIFALAIVARAVNIWLIEDVNLHALVEDSPIYWNGAKYWIDSGFFSDLSNGDYVHNTERVPLYFIFLMPFRLLFGDTLLPVLLTQSILDAVSCVMIAKLGSFIDFKTGVVSGFCAALWYNLVLHSSLILTETLFLFLICILLLGSANFVSRGKLYHAVLIGLACGLGIMTRTVVALLPLAIALITPVVTQYQMGSWRKGAFAGIVIIVFSLLPVSPILYRNIVNFDTVQLTSQNGVFVLNWVVGLSKSLESGRGFDLESRALNNKFYREVEKTFGPNAKLNAFEKSEQKLVVAKREMGEMAVSTLVKAWLYGAVNNLMSPVVAIDPRIRDLNTKSFYNSAGHNLFDKAYHFLKDNNPVFVLSVFLASLSVVFFSVLQLGGWVFLLRFHFWVAVLGAFYVLYFLMVSGPVGSAKYRIPIEPALIIFQSFAIKELIELYLRRIPKA